METTTLFLCAQSIGGVLESQEMRARLREELDPQLADINARLRSGWRVENVDYVLLTEGEGLRVVLTMARQTRP